MKAIETVYKGYRFRSRLEARWAVFFDALGIAWEYEKEGFELGGGVRYLPDFWLSTVNMWAEVKTPAGFDKDAMLKVFRLAEQTGFPVLLLEGIPENKPYKAFEKGETFLREYCLTNYHNYPQEEHRFYCSPGDIEDRMWEDTEKAALAATSARFEFGEHG